MVSTRNEDRVVVLSAPGTDVVASALRRLPGAQVVEVRSEAEVLDRLEETAVLVSMNTAYSARIAEALRRAASVQLIQLLTAGYDQLQRFGVPAHVRVATAGPSRSPAVAEHAMALLLSWTRALPQARVAQERRHWDIDIRPRLDSLLESTLLIVGFGSIGQELAVRARAFGAGVEGVNRTGRPHPLADRMHTPEQLLQALGSADFVVLALPSTAQSRGLFSTAQFAAMKPSTVFVNVARGDVVDTAALIEALDNGRIRAAALDVFDEEPLPADSALWGMDNVVITPHVGGISGQVGHRILARFVADNVGRVLSGEAPEYWVASENFQPR